MCTNVTVNVDGFSSVIIRTSESQDKDRMKGVVGTVGVVVFIIVTVVGVVQNEHWQRDLTKIGLVETSP